jgi:hypothetical protein
VRAKHRRRAFGRYAHVHRKQYRKQEGSERERRRETLSSILFLRSRLVLSKGHLRRPLADIDKSSRRAFTEKEPLRI